MDMVKDEDGYCTQEFDERMDHMYMWVLHYTIHINNDCFTYHLL